MSNYPTITILDVTIDCVDFAQTLAQIAEWMEEPRNVCRQICTVNPEFVMTARQNLAFAAVLEQADLRVADGVGLLWAARLQGLRLRERVTGSDGIFRICEKAAEHGWHVYLLGAAPGIASGAADILRQRYPNLLISGTFSGSPNEDEWPAILERLQTASTDILFVAFGHPRQDLWIARHRAELPVQVAIGVGGAFDFVAGVIQRAPLWIQYLGLEWLYRLWREPWRWRRILSVMKFGILVLGEKVIRRG
ncbi:WecB/TagA/CpsF family glycosyltransferase [Chloroflexi bacterium TSY]|nr:WecB/TagA/CpsF family glycosyltransferase [Chloroflexi bacterium TSY]